MTSEREEALNRVADEKAASIKVQQSDAQQRHTDKEAKLKQTKKEWKEREQERAESPEIQLRVKQDADRRAEAQWNSTVAVLVFKLDTLLTNEHDVHELAKIIGRDKRLTEKQRKALLRAAERIHDRVDNVKRLLAIPVPALINKE